MTEQTVDDGLGSLPLWKVVPMALGTVVCLLLVVVVSNGVAGLVPDVVPDSITYSVVGLLVTVVALTAYARLVFKRSLRWFAFRDPDASTIPWIAAGLALPAVAVAINTVFHGGQVVGTNVDPTTVAVSLLGSVGVGLFTAVLEEFVFRGMLFRLLEDRFNVVVAILAPALVFSVLHTGRADTQVELWLVLARTVVGGVLFGLIVHRTRNLWNAVAVHAGWNFFLGARIVRVAEPGGTPGEALLRMNLTEVGPLGTAVSLTNTPATIALLLVAGLALVVGVNGRAGRRVETSR